MKKIKNFKIWNFFNTKKKTKNWKKSKNKRRKKISKRNVVLFKPSKEFKEFINSEK